MRGVFKGFRDCESEGEFDLRVFRTRDINLLVLGLVRVSGKSVQGC